MAGGVTERTRAKGADVELIEAKRRDGVLRAYFVGKDWDENDEFRLKRDLVLRSTHLIPDYPYVVEDEWEVVAGATNHGRGDLVFADGRGGLAVVEVKFIDLGRSGHTVRVKRTKSRGLVREQAISYAAVMARRYPNAIVRGYSYTNEDAAPTCETSP